MRIVHFSDLHIGVENHGRVDPATGLSTRLLDFLSALDELVEYCLSSDVDLVVLAGDAYKGRDPSQTHQREFARRLAKLSTAGIGVFLLVGNHDLPAALGRATAVDATGFQRTGRRRPDHLHHAHEKGACADSRSPLAQEERAAEQGRVPQLVP